MSAGTNVRSDLQLYQRTGRSKPRRGLAIDKAGNLYGTTESGGYMGGNCKVISGCGTVFKLTYENSGWILIPLYTFVGGSDGDGASNPG